MKIGYARCSTDGQNLDGQLDLLKKEGCEAIYSEKVSGGRIDRPELMKALKAMKQGSMLVVTSLDRLARSTRDLLNILDTIGKASGHFKSLRETWADTSTAHGRLILTVLGGLAEFERELIQMRTSEGRQRAVEVHGIKLGPKFKLSPEQKAYVAAERAKGVSVREIARVVGVSPATISRIPPAGL